jgi:hypothetical protein
MKSPTDLLRRRLEQERDALNRRIEALYMAESALKSEGLEGWAIDNWSLGEGEYAIDIPVAQLITHGWCYKKA